MKILFLHVYSEKNPGDTAIVSVMLHQYREQYPKAEIVLSSVTVQKNKSFQDAPYVSSFFQEAIYRGDESSLQRVLRTAWIALGAATNGIFFGGRLKQFANAVKEADLIIGVGGGYIQGKDTVHGWATLILTLLEIWFCARLGKKIILEAMSIGPFGNVWQEKLASRVLNRVDTIHVRENITYALLKKLHITGPQIIKSSDLAFYFNPHTKTNMRNYLMKRGVFFTKPVLGVTVKKCFPYSDPRQEKYEEAIAFFVNKLVNEKDIKVLFIPHVTAKAQNDDDRDVIQRIKPLLIRNEKITLLMEEYNYRDIKGIYENLNWLVGTRMHSVIFALTAEIPVVAIAYEPKTTGIMATLGLGKNVLSADGLTASALYKVFCEL